MYMAENGWTIIFYPWDDLSGKPRVAGRFKTTKEKDDFFKWYLQTGFWLDGWRIGNVKYH